MINEPLLSGRGCLRSEGGHHLGRLSEYFADHGLPFDYVLYTNYERQVEALFRRAHSCGLEFAACVAAGGADCAGLLRRSAEAIAMRDTDRDLTSIVIARAGDSAAHRC